MPRVARRPVRRHPLPTLLDTSFTAGNCRGRRSGPLLSPAQAPARGSVERAAEYRSAGRAVCGLAERQHLALSRHGTGRLISALGVGAPHPAPPDYC